jgi:hypothetical protein
MGDDVVRRHARYSRLRHARQRLQPVAAAQIPSGAGLRGAPDDDRSAAVRAWFRSCSVTEAIVETATPSTAGRPPAATTRRRVTATAATVALVLLAVVVLQIVVSDPRAAPLVGDEASFVYNAISLRRGDLSYDARDQADWMALGWDTQPRGLFLQSTEHGWAVAKPIGYSVVLAPAIWLFGLRGIQVTGALLLLAYASCWYFAGRLRWSRSTSVLVAVAAAVASHAWFYAFAAHADLWVATLVGIVVLGCLRAALGRDPRWFWIAGACAGLLATEKSPALAALVPVLVVTGVRLARQHAATGLGLLILTGVLSTLPYLYYSGGATWSPYGADRFSAPVITPWSGGSGADLDRLTTDEVLSPSFVLEQVRSPSADVPGATLTYIVGRHTGVLTFLPIVPALVVAAVFTLVRRRPTADPELSDDDARAVAAQQRQAARGPTSSEGATSAATAHELVLPALAWAGLLSLVLYVGFYVVVFTDNYYGGGQSIGNRYFLQFSVVALVIPVAAGLRERAALSCTAFAVLWAAFVLAPLFGRSPVMLAELWHTSPVQRQLPAESTQRYAGFWAEDYLAPTSGPWDWSASQLPSQSGTAEGTSISAASGRDEPGYVVFGPYLRMEPGSYLLTIEYSSPTDPSDPVAWVEVNRSGRSYSSLQLPGTFAAGVSATLEFDADGGLGWETRVLWDGGEDFTLRSIRIERIGDPR